MNVLIAGDFVPYGRVAPQLEVGDYSCMVEVKPIIQRAEYSIVNFECPIASKESKPIVKTGPVLCCSDGAMTCVVQTGFKCVTLANNHFRDYGQEGVEATLSACSKNSVDYVGGGRNKAEAGKVLYKEIEGRLLAVINVCEHEWSIATETYGGSNPINPYDIYHSIKEAREQADYVLVIVHGGHELWQLPSPRMKKLYRFFIDVGADAVVNHHQHCFSGYEVYDGKPIFYGLGNFCFDRGGYHSELWEIGYMVIIHFDETISFEIIPYRQCGECPVVHVLTEDEEILFEKKVEELNCIIENDGKLLQAFEDYLNHKSKDFLFVMSPYRKKLFAFLFAKGLLPSFFPRRNYLLLKEMFTCESHYDSFMFFINKQIESI